MSATISIYFVAGASEHYRGVTSWNIHDGILTIDSFEGTKGKVKRCIMLHSVHLFRVVEE